VVEPLHDFEAEAIERTARWCRNHLHDSDALVAADPHETDAEVRRD
jgi:hypothetical protein